MPPLLAGLALCALAATPWAAPALAGLGALLLLAVPLRAWRTHRHEQTRGRTAAASSDRVMNDLQALDQHMLGQLDHAVHLSETSTLQVVSSVTGLRSLSGRLMDYLHTAQSQSARMQDEIERNGSIVAELAGFVQQLPQQIAREREYLDELVGEVRKLSAFAETIRNMARQTEILSINAAVAAARAGDAGRVFSVLAGEVRRLAKESNQSAQEIDGHIRRLVGTVQARSTGEFAERMKHNESEAARLLALTGRLDEGYIDMRQFYAMLLTAITEHNSALDQDIVALLDTTQYQDVFKQAVDRLHPAVEGRHEVAAELVRRLSLGQRDTAGLDDRAASLLIGYLAEETRHGATDALDLSTPGAARPPRIELF